MTIVIVSEKGTWVRLIIDMNTWCVVAPALAEFGAACWFVVQFTAVLA